jgi:predicted dehydrogenase/nucleoside-diphosphate-sugar epimerase
MTSQSAPLRVAIVGAGKMGRHHATAIRRLAPAAELVAVADRDAAFARAFADDLGVPAWHDDLATLMREARPDVVHIVTAPPSHAALARTALEGGAHIYVEKPFAETGADAEALLALAAARGRQVCAGHQLLFERPTLRSADLVRHLGEIRHVESYFAFRQARRGDGRTPLTAEEQLLDILPHPAYLLVHFLGADTPGATLDVLAMRADERGEVHAIVAAGRATGHLTVTLSGRPVDSYVKVVGTRGTVTLDYVRGVVVAQLGQGSTIDKILDPYARGWTIVAGSTASLGRRFLKKERSYPGLAEAFGAFYAQIQRAAPAPVSVDNIRHTVALCDRAREALAASRLAAGEPAAPTRQPTVAVTGGTGLLGREVVARLLAAGVTPLVLARRVPPARDRVPGVHYAACDLGAGDVPLPPTIETVIHCAAETAGSWDAHQRNSIDATRNVLDAMRARGIGRLVHVSSLAVIDADAPQPLSERSPLERDGRRRGAYVWGKLESERIAAAAPQTHGVAVRIVRPGALVSAVDYEPPGKLGRAVGSTFVAMGSPKATIPISDVEWAGEMTAWIATHFDQAPPLAHAINPVPATRRDLAQRLKRVSPHMRVVWFPTPLLALTSGMLTVVQKALRPGRTAVNLKSAFDAPRCDTEAVRAIAVQARRAEPAAVAPATDAPATDAPAAVAP